MIRIADRIDGDEWDSVLARVQSQTAAGKIRVTQHVGEEMVAESISLSDTLEAVAVGQLIENYPDHRRGPCCLLGGWTLAGRPIHVVCTTARPVLVIITVYEPLPPKWVTPTQRGFGS